MSGINYLLICCRKYLPDIYFWDSMYFVLHYSLLGQFVLIGTIRAIFQLFGTVSTLYYISAYWDSPSLVAFAYFLA